MKLVHKLCLVALVIACLRCPATCDEARQSCGVKDLLPVFRDRAVGRMVFPMSWTSGTFRDFEAWKKSARAKVKECMLVLPPDVPFDPVVVGEEDRGTYVARKVEFNVTGDSRVTGYLLVPKGKGRHPAVLLLHDHGAKLDIGKEKMIRPFNVSLEKLASADDWVKKLYGGRFLGDELAKRGYVCFCTDALNWSDRGGAGVEEQQALGSNMLHLGMSWAGVIAHEDMRAAEFLATRPEVDPGRVASMGLSMGSYRSLQVAALSDHITAGVAMCWLCTTEGFMRPGINRTKGQATFAMLHPGLANYLDFPDIASLACPKPMLVYNGLKDTLFPIDAVEAAYSKMHKVWDSRHAGERLVTKFWDVSHEFNLEMQEEAFKWLERQFSAGDGGGTASIDFNGKGGRKIEVPCGATGTWTITYTVPRGGMAAGGGIRVVRVPNKYWLGQCKQAEDPKAMDYVSATRSDGGNVKIGYIGRFYKDHVEAQVVVDSAMAEGTKIVLKVGDRGGSAGATVPYSWQPPCRYIVESDLDGDGKGRGLDKPLVVVPVAGRAARFVAVIPSYCRVGEKVSLRIRAEDAGSNVCERFIGELALSCTDRGAKAPKKVVFYGKDKGVKAVSMAFSTPGVHYISVRAIKSAAAGCSNPAKVTRSEPAYRAYWGDLHCHTEVSDGTGSIDWNYTYGRDISWLDFMALTDHLDPGLEGYAQVMSDSPSPVTMDVWRSIESAAARQYYARGRFATFFGYEWSGSTQQGGDHNVYYVDDRAKMQCKPDVKDEYGDLRSRGKKAAFIIPHVGGRTSDPDRHDPVVEPSVEVNSMHGHFEWFAQEYLQKGYLVGFNGGSDGHFGLPGNDIWSNHGRLGLARRDISRPQGITCVIAPSLTREAVRDAIFARHTYAATNVRILLEVTMDGHMMGEEYSSSSAPKIRVAAAGTGKIERIEIIRNSERILNRKVKGRVVNLDFTDTEPVSGRSYYYVRLSQEDGEIAWSSPVFFTYTGAAVAQKRQNVPWNYESDEDEPGNPVGRDYSAELEEHLSLRAPGRLYELKQVRTVHSPRGDYALFYGRDRSKSGQKVHVRWYYGFEQPRLSVTSGWRDFGSVGE